MEKHKQNHCKSTKFWLTFRLFRAGKQRIRNKATYLETGFPKNYDEMLNYISVIFSCTNAFVCVIAALER